MHACSNSPWVTVHLHRVGSLTHVRWCTNTHVRFRKPFEVVYVLSLLKIFVVIKNQTQSLACRLNLYVIAHVVGYVRTRFGMSWSVATYVRTYAGPNLNLGANRLLIENTMELPLQKCTPQLEVDEERHPMEQETDPASASDAASGLNPVVIAGGSQPCSARDDIETSGLQGTETHTHRCSSHDSHCPHGDSAVPLLSLHQSDEETPHNESIAQGFEDVVGVVDDFLLQDEVETFVKRKMKDTIQWL